MIADPPREELVDLFTYDSKTGALCWRTATKGHYAGKLVGHLHNRRGRLVAISGTVYQCRRIAWIIEHGDIIPGAKIIVANRDPNDLRIDNLREWTRVDTPRSVITQYRGKPVADLATREAAEIAKLVARTKPERMFNEGGTEVTAADLRVRLERATLAYGEDIKRAGGGSWSNAAYHAPVVQFEATA